MDPGKINHTIHRIYEKKKFIIISTIIIILIITKNRESYRTIFFINFLKK